MSRPTFDLITEPWIRVRFSTGETTEVSLHDAFARAHQIKAIAGELATQDVAILRLLLAILRRSHPDAQGTEAWGELWRSGRFDLDRVAAYLAGYRERFDLLHPETPFYQVADLRTAKGEFTDLTRLVADVPPGHQYFTTRAGSALHSMEFSEAARWIVHCQAFDPSGIKSGAVGDDRVKGGKGYPIGVAWCGWLGLVVIEGTTLFETLLLNLPIGPDDSDPAVDRPVWERPAHTPAVEGRAYPSGPADLQTWQSRRIRLGHDGTKATAVLIANGDPLHPRNRHHEETMTGWRRSEAQMKALGTREDVFMPREHRPERAVWRGLGGLLATGEEASTARPGRWLLWLEALRDDGELSDGVPVAVRTIGVHYGSQSSVIGDITDDALRLSVATLDSPDLRVLAVDAVRDADTAVRQLGLLGAELVEAAGGSGDAIGHARGVARERGYEALDVPYRTWVRDLRADTDTDDARLGWQRLIYDVIRSVAADLIRSAGEAAWIGREVSRGATTIYLDAAVAEIAFHRQLRTAFRSAFENEQEGDAA